MVSIRRKPKTTTKRKTKMETMTIQQVAEKVEAEMHNDIQGWDDPFSVGEAQIYGTDGETITFVSAHADIYELLASKKSLPAKDSPFVVAVTTGWAAPLNTETGECDGAPSQHPERRRVRLTIVANATDTYSIIRFADNADEIVGDDGGATGSLADAIRNFVAK
jgi:hypothetical protein